VNKTVCYCKVWDTVSESNWRAEQIEAVPPPGRGKIKVGWNEGTGSRMGVVRDPSDIRMNAHMGTRELGVAVGAEPTFSKKFGVVRECR